jgi:hypothetical protein
VDDNKINNAQKYTYFADKFYCQGDVVVQYGAYLPMEHIPGFTRSHWMLPFGECLGLIAAAAAIVEYFE